MTVYIIFMIVVTILVACCDITGKKFYYYIATIIMSIFAGIRYGVGTDYWTYNSMFKSASRTQIATYEGDKGFLLISKFISSFTENTRVHFFLISIFIVISIMIFIYKYSKLKILSVAIYFGLGGYFISFNIMRQYIAIAIVSYSIKYLITNKNIKYYCLILIASTFHSTALIMLPIKILIDINWSKKLYVFMSGISIFMYYNINFFVELFEKNDRIGMYADSYYTNVGSNKITLIVHLIIFLFCFFYRDKRDYKNSDKFLKLSSLGLIFIFIGTRGLIFNRIATYFNLAILTLVPNTFLNLKKKDYYLMGYLILCCLFLYTIILLMTQGGLLPYKIS